MENKDELETLVEISELLDSIRLKVPQINYDFNSLDTDTETEEEIAE